MSYADVLYLPVFGEGRQQRAGYGDEVQVVGAVRKWQEGRGGGVDGGAKPLQPACLIQINDAEGGGSSVSTYAFQDWSQVNFMTPPTCLLWVLPGHVHKGRFALAQKGSLLKKATGILEGNELKAEKDKWGGKTEETREVVIRGGEDHGPRAYLHIHGMPLRARALCISPCRGPLLSFSNRDRDTDRAGCVKGKGKGAWERTGLVQMQVAVVCLTRLSDVDVQPDSLTDVGLGSPVL